MAPTFLTENMAWIYGLNDGLIHFFRNSPSEKKRSQRIASCQVFFTNGDYHGSIDGVGWILWISITFSFSNAAMQGSMLWSHPPIRFQRPEVFWGIWNAKRPNTSAGIWKTKVQPPITSDPLPCCASHQCLPHISVAASLAVRHLGYREADMAGPTG